MTEAIVITSIIVGGLVAIAWIVLHFGYKAWRAERADAKDAYHVAFAQTSPSFDIQSASGLDEEEAKRIQRAYFDFRSN
jgi:hypothetical protein